MLIKNWMNKDTVTISSDMTAKEAMDILIDNKKLFIPVVDENRLRGILARSDLREAASFATASQNIHEIDFFNTRLKVKDIMVRNPITLSVDDTFESALQKGANLNRRFFPVVDGDEIAGTISDVDIFNSLYQILNVDENYSGITIEKDQIEKNDIKNIISYIDQFDCQLHCIFTINQQNFNRIVLRLFTHEIDSISRKLSQEGYNIIEVKHGDTSLLIDVEGYLIQHPAVDECAVVDNTEFTSFSDFIAYIVLNDNYNESNALKEELNEYIKEKNVNKSMEVTFINKLPKTATGKVQKYVLKSEY